MWFTTRREFNHAVAAILILTIVLGFSFVLVSDWNMVSWAFITATIIIAVSIIAKKVAAHLLDSDVEHQLWTVENWGLKPHQHFENPVPASLIFPLLFTIISLGSWKIMTVLTYEARALKARAAKRFGFYSYAEMTEWHNGLIGAAGVIALLALSTVSYLVGFEFLARISAYYAFFNMVPLSKLDGTQIFFGSKVLWTCLAVITFIFTLYALVLPF